MLRDVVPSSRPTVLSVHALDMAALQLIGDGATADQLAQHFDSLKAACQPTGAAMVLTRLARLGLVRVASSEGGTPRYVLTSLGEQHARGALGAQPGIEAQLATLERLRTDLLSTIAHELRTPLTAIRSSVGLLRDPRVRPDEAAREQLLDRIAHSAERMQRLVTDVLDLARFRSGSLKLQARRFDAVVLAREAGAAVASLLQAREQTLDLVLPAAPIWVYGDHRRLEQALVNLLSNAHKFSPNGASIGLAVTADNADVVWTVSDTGPGIAPEDRARVFERFFTAASDSAGSGAGLGLPIALAVAQAHGGAIGLVSEPGRGSAIALRVPAQGLAELGDL
jgi:signal transduction histidine kinase